MTRKRWMTTLVTVASLLLVSGQALAQPRLPSFQSGQVLTADQLNRIVEQVRKNANGVGGNGDGVTHTVDCNAGETIQSKVDAAQPGDTIMITGTCNEAVVVNKDGITLDGGGTAVIDGSGMDAAVIRIWGHQNVTVKGLTVQNGIYGIELAQSAAAWLEDVTARGSRSQSRHDGYGIAVYGSSTIDLTGTIVANDNASSGILVTSSSSAVVFGGVVIDGQRLPRASLQVSGNGQGVSIYSGSSFWVGGSQTAITVTNNAFSGLSIAGASSASLYGDTAIFSNNEGPGVYVSGSSSFTSGSRSAEFNSNGGSGVAVFEGSTATIYGEDIRISGNRGYAGLWVSRGSTVVAYNLTVENNDLRGIGVYRNSYLDLYDSLITGGHDRYGIQVYTSRTRLQSVTSTDNAGDGLAVFTNSHVNLRGGSSITDNEGRGIIAASMDVGVDIADSIITGNATDIEVGKGGRIGWRDSTIGTIECADSVLTFDDAMCPE